jgi:uncharacterized membrane protein YccC
VSFSPAIAKQSFKTALAITIAYAISLSMGWENPYWAALAIIMVSLSTVGESLNKGALRLVGTLLAATAALVLLGCFAQDRWWYITGLSAYLGFCIYMIKGKRHQYLWWCAAFVTLVITAHAAGDIGNPFPVAVLRMQQNLMGIVVYMLVSVFLWPSSTQGRLHAATRDLLAAQARIFRAYRGLARGHGSPGESYPLRTREARLIGQFEEALRGAETDSYEVNEMRHDWWRLHRDCTNLLETLEQWRESFPEVRSLKPHLLAPNLEAVYEEIDALLTGFERMFAGEAPASTPEPVALALDAAAVGELGHFERAAVAVARAHLERLQTLARSLFEGVRNLTGQAARGPVTRPVEARRNAPATQHPATMVLDTDRLLAAGKTVAAVWIAFLIWFYVDPPGHQSFVELAILFYMAMVMMRFDPAKMIKPIMIGALLCGIPYIFIMPHLSSFMGLGTLIFATMFAIGYILGEPRLGGAKMVVSAVFVFMIGVQNEQSYSFVGYLDALVMLALSAGLFLLAMYYLPPSPRPEKVFLRLVARFFRRCDHLLSDLTPARRAGLLRRWLAQFYQADLLELPQKLAASGAEIDHAAFPGNSPEQVVELVNSLHAIALRIKEIREVYELPHADLFLRDLSDDIRAWRLVAQENSRRWAEDPAVAAGLGVELQERLVARLAALEQRVEEIFRSVGEGELGDKDYENLYRLLGSFRGLADAGVGYARLAGSIDWTQWREERFT